MYFATGKDLLATSISNQILFPPTIFWEEETIAAEAAAIAHNQNQKNRPHGPILMILPQLQFLHHLHTAVHKERSIEKGYNETNWSDISEYISYISSMYLQVSVINNVLLLKDTCYAWGKYNTSGYFGR